MPETTSTLQGHPARTIRTIRTKERAPGRCYDGARYPHHHGYLPEVPLVENGEPVLLVPGAGSGKKFVRIQEMDYKQAFAEASEYAESGMRLDGLPDPIRDYAAKCIQFPDLGDRVRTTTNKEMTRERWLYQGIKCGKPAALTAPQRDELLRAGYWAHAGTEPQKVVARKVVDYYRQAGHHVELFRPYARRRATRTS